MCMAITWHLKIIIILLCGMLMDYIISMLFLAVFGYLQGIIIFEFLQAIV